MRFFDHFFSSKGRITRAHYWFSSFVILFWIMAGFQLATLIPTEYAFAVKAAFAVTGVVSLFFIWAKRLHDMGFSGLWALLLLPIPFVNLAAGLFWLGFIYGGEKENRFGLPHHAKITKQTDGLIFKKKAS